MSHNTRLFLLTPPLSVEKLGFFPAVLLFTKFLRKFESGVFNIYKIVRIRVGGFIIYKNVPQDQSLFGPFLTVSPLITSKNLNFFARFARNDSRVSKKFPRFARVFYYLQKKSAALRAAFLLSTKSQKKQIGGLS